MNSSLISTKQSEGAVTTAIVGGGPAGLVLAIATEKYSDWISFEFEYPSEVRRKAERLWPLWI